MTPKGREELNHEPLMATELIEALQSIVSEFGDKPVQIAQWMATDEDANDGVGYVWPYSDGGMDDGGAPDYFYLHGAPV